MDLIDRLILRGHALTHCRPAVTVSQCPRFAPSSPRRRSFVVGLLLVCCWFVGSFVRWFVRSLVRPFGCSLGCCCCCCCCCCCPFIRAWVRSFVRACVRAFVVGNCSRGCGWWWWCGGICWCCWCCWCLSSLSLRVARFGWGRSGSTFPSG